MYPDSSTHPERLRRPADAPRGFTLVELLVVLAILGVLLAILVPVVAKLIQAGYRTTCKNNIHEIARACYAYGQSGKYTRGRSSLGNALPSTNPIPTDWGNLATGNAGGLWLLVEYKLVARDSMFCPEAEMHRSVGKIPPAATTFAPDTLCYSYLSQVNFPTRTSHDPASLVIVADKNPRCIAGVTGVSGSGAFALAVNDSANSANHDGQGQYVALLDGSVQWLDAPDAYNEDDIYASSSETAGEEDQGLRGSRADIFLLP